MNLPSAELEISRLPPEQAAVSVPRAVLQARGLKRSFGKVCAVDGLDLTVRAGEIYGFLGVNGAGKTTAIRMLMGIIKPDAGELELLGERTRRTSIRQKQSIGYVSQEQTFYPWMTCRALGRFVGGLYPTWDAAEFDRLLQMLALPPDRKTSQLSGGMRMKLALALALAPRPALLILDEPTSGLDPLARREFLEIIRRETREHGRTTFFSSHIISEIERVADRVGIIHQGRMLFEGTLQELRSTVRAVEVPAPAQPVPHPPPLPAPPPISVALHAVPSTPELAPPAVGYLPPEAALPANATVEPPVPAAWSPPATLQVLRDEVLAPGTRSLVLRGAPEAWAEVSGDDVVARELSVEDIFVALVGKGAIVA